MFATRRGGRFLGPDAEDSNGESALVINLSHRFLTISFLDYAMNRELS